MSHRNSDTHQVWHWAWQSMPSKLLSSLDDCPLHSYDIVCDNYTQHRDKKYWGYRHCVCCCILDTFRPASPLLRAVKVRLPLPRSWRSSCIILSKSVGPSIDFVASISPSRLFVSLCSQEILGFCIQPPAAVYSWYCTCWARAKYTRKLTHFNFLLLVVYNSYTASHFSCSAWELNQAPLAQIIKTMPSVKIMNTATILEFWQAAFSSWTGF